MYGYIYKTTNLINNKIYIGKKVSEVFVESYKGSGKLILAAIKKYGKQNFICEILEWCNSLEELNNKEKYYIEFYNSRDLSIGYNISKGGDGGDIFHTLSEEHQKEVIQKFRSRKGTFTCITDGIITKIVKKKDLQEYLEKGFRIGVSEERRQITLKAARGYIHKINSGCWKSGQKPWNKGIPCPEEKKIKISKTLTGMKQSSETSKKRSKSMKEKYKNGYKNPMTGKQPWNKGLNFIWVANKEEIRYISPAKLQEFLDKGYHKGRKKY